MAVEISSRQELEEWLTDKPVEWAQVIAARSALRVFPLVLDVARLPDRVLPLGRKQGSILQVFRANLISWAARKFPAHEMGAAISGAARAAAAARAARAAAYATYAAYATTDAARAAATAAAYATTAYATSARAAAYARAATTARAAADAVSARAAATAAAADAAAAARAASYARAAAARASAATADDDAAVSARAASYVRAAAARAAAAAAAAATAAAADDAVSARASAARAAAWEVVSADCQWLLDEKGALIRQPLWPGRDAQSAVGDAPLWSKESLYLFESLPDWGQGAVWGLIPSWYRTLLPDSPNAQPRSYFGEQADLEIATQSDTFWTITEERSAEQILLEIGKIAGQ